MKKILYFLMMALGIAIIAILWLMPFYKFDKTKCLENNSEYILLVDTAISEGATEVVNETDIKTFENQQTEVYAEATQVGKDTFKEKYKNELLSYYALMHDDSETYFKYNEYQVLNEVKKNLASEMEYLVSIEEDQAKKTAKQNILDSINKVKDLEFGASDDDVTEMKTKLSDFINSIVLAGGSSTTIDERCTTIETSLMETRKQAIIDYLTDNNLDKSASVTAMEVTAGSFAAYLFLDIEGGYGTEDYTARVTDYTENGVGVQALVRCWQNVIEEYKELFSQEEYASLGFFDKVKAMFGTEYDIAPLLLVTAGVLILICAALRMFFGGIKGMAGKKYPKTFLGTLVGAALCYVLIHHASIIPYTFWYKYEISSQMARLDQLFMVGNFCEAVNYIELILIAASVIAILGRFCKWGKKAKKKSNDDD